MLEEEGSGTGQTDHDMRHDNQVLTGTAEGEKTEKGGGGENMRSDKTLQNKKDTFRDQIRAEGERHSLRVFSVRSMCLWF